MILAGLRRTSGMSPKSKPATSRKHSVKPSKKPARKRTVPARKPRQAPTTLFPTLPTLVTTPTPHEGDQHPPSDVLVGPREMERLAATVETMAAEVRGEGRLTTQQAHLWRQVVRQCIATDEQPEIVRGIIAAGIDRGAWRHFTDPDGRPFDTFDAFCECPEPHGLGRGAADVMAALERVLGRKAAQLATVPVARQGRRADLTAGTSRHNGGKSGNRNEERLRAIDNGHPVIRDLFHRDLIGIAEAAKVAAKVDDPATAVLIPQVEAVATQPDLDPKAARQRINRLVAEVLDPDKPLRAALAAYRKLSDDQQARFRTEIDKAPGEDVALDEGAG